MFEATDWAKFGVEALIIGYLLWSQNNQNKWVQSLFNDLKKSLNNNTKAIEDLSKLFNKHEEK